MMKDGEMVVTGSIEEITQDRSNSRIIEIELIQPSSRIEGIASEWPTLSDLSSLNESSTLFQFSHSGDRHDLSKFLAKLVEEKLEVVSFSARKSKVEDLFMEIDSSNQDELDES